MMPNSDPRERLTDHILKLMLGADHLIFWGGGGAWVIFQKKFLSLVLKEKNNLALKRVKKNNLSLKRAKKITWPGLRKKAHFKGKASILFYFCNVSLASGGLLPPRPPPIYTGILHMLNTSHHLFLFSFFIPITPYLCNMIV